MPSQVHERGPAKVQMNMTPLIDVTFQIIIFFMLINNIVAQQTVKMFVPELDDPETRRPEAMSKVVVNVAPVDHVLPNQYKFAERRNAPLLGIGREVAGAVQIGSIEYRLKGPNSMPFDEALDKLTEQLEQAVAANPEIEVELRADCALYYDQVQLVMGAIGEAGAKKVHLAAYLPDEVRKPAEATGTP